MPDSRRTRRLRLPADRVSISRMRTKYGIKRPAWCVTHADFAWLYHDGSQGCWWECIVESHDEDHEIVPIVVELPKSAVLTQREVDAR